MIPELVLPCSKAFNDPAGGRQWLLAPVLSCSQLARITPRAGGCPEGGSKPGNPLLSWVLHFFLAQNYT